jgi:adenine/guanine phosphoribosyltransferase-like PRPP-binding protein
MCYFEMLFTRTEAVVDTIDHWLKCPKLGQVDCVVGIGLSGTMPLVPVRQKSGVNVRALRKDGVESHGGASASSEYMTQARYVILDDFVESGRTLVGLRARMEKLYPQWECVGVLLYGQYLSPNTFTDIPIIGLAEEVDELHKLRGGE